MKRKSVKSKVLLREKIVMLITLLAIIIMLCIPKINKALLGVLGYAVYAYVLALSIMILLLIRGYRITLPKRKVLLYVFIFIFLVLTLHIGFTKSLTTKGYSEYLFQPFAVGTPGGMMASILTAYLVIPIGYLLSLLIFFLITTILIFIAIFPIFIKEETNSKEDTKIKKKLLERLSATDSSSRVARKKEKELKVLNIEEQEESVPLTVEDYTEAPRTKEDARTLLFGDKPRPKRIPRHIQQPIYDEKKEEKQEEDPYQILPNIQASIIQPQDKWYTNDFLGNKDKARSILLQTDKEEDYKSRYGESKVQKKEDIQPFKMNEYRPDQSSRPEQDSLSLEPTISHIERPTTTYRRSPTNHTKEKKPRRVAPRQTRAYIQPHAGILEEHRVKGFSPTISDKEYNSRKETLETTLQHFSVNATVFNAIKGPTVTRYELRLAQEAGNSVNKVINLHKDLKMVLEAEGEINILAPIRGKNAIGIEIPNKQRGIVSLREIVCTPEFQDNKNGIKLALGKMLDGRPFIGDLEEMPHLLVAGATGTGKSVCINAIIASILFHYSPEEVRLLLIDPKKVELINYIGLPHLLLKEPLIEISEIVTALKWIREETAKRFNKFKDMRVVNINDYNQHAKENGLEAIPKIVIIIDEASELMTKAKKEVEDTLSSLARIGRAAGVHLIFATQSPTKDVITSEIQNNLNTKIAFAVSDYVHSQVIFKTVGAERLLGKGDMFIKGSGGELTRIQCSYIDSKEIQRLVKYIIDNNEADFDEELSETIINRAKATQDIDCSSDAKGLSQSFMNEVKEALKIGLQLKRLSTSLLQRRMEKGYNGAARIMDYLEENGYIEEPDGSNRRREVLISVEKFLELFPEEKENMQDLIKE